MGMLLYIDPGTGSMLFSLAVGVLSAAWFGARALLMKAKYRTGGKADTNKKDIVIYGEDKRYWTTFKGILDEFERRQVKVTYLAGSADDPLLSQGYRYVETEVIGLGNKAYARLNFLNARIVLATTPGLDVYQWKRSKGVDWYVKIPHALGSFTEYRLFGTEFYDALLGCTDSYDTMLREIERKRGSKPKELVTIGCTYMDYLWERRMSLQEDSLHHGVHVLFAPSWGERSLLYRFGESFLDRLVETGFDITFRPHPQSFISDKELMNRLEAKYPETPLFHWDRNPDNFNALRNAEVLISDFSSIVFDYAYVFERPVIYTESSLDFSKTDQAWVDEPSWTQLVLPQIGVELKESNFENIGAIVTELTGSDSYHEAIVNTRDQYWENRGHAAEKTVDYLLSKLKELS